MTCLCDRCGADMTDFLNVEGEPVSELCLDRWQGGSVMDDKRHSWYHHLCDECYEEIKASITAFLASELKCIKKPADSG